MPEASRQFRIPTFPRKVNTVPVMMTDLAAGDRFVGPDERTAYTVLVDCHHHQNRGWMNVRTIGVPHTWNESQQAFDDEGFFAYTYPDKVRVWKFVDAWALV